MNESIPASTRCGASGTSATSSPARKDATVAIFVPVDDFDAISLPGIGPGVAKLMKELREPNIVGCVVADCV